MVPIEEIHDAAILVVDDKPVNLQIVRKILEKDGYTNIDTTVDPTQVLPLYDSSKYDLILLDIHMPVLNGFQVMEMLRDAHSDDYLPILVLTADEDEETRHMALSSGARDFVKKPFDRVEVLLRSRNLIEVTMLYKEQRRSNIVLEEKVRERTKELYDSQVKLIQCLGKAAEYKDTDTGMHVVRISKTCAIVAQALGLGEKEVEMIKHASPMHDVGKIGIPDRVLLKPGKLDGEDWEIMKNHTLLGANILAGAKSELVQVASNIARTHHEKWDGSGYPNGLKGEGIPLYTRIVSVCDVFDALVSRRPYKKAWSHESAMEFVQGQSGLSFDPKVVDCFESVLPEILQINEQYPDHHDSSLNQSIH